MKTLTVELEDDQYETLVDLHRMAARPNEEFEETVRAILGAGVMLMIGIYERKPYAAVGIILQDGGVAHLMEKRPQ